MARWFPGCVSASLIASAVLCPIAARAETPRELLTQAGFVDRDRNVALARIDRRRQRRGRR